MSRPAASRRERPYWTLFQRDDAASPWGAAFGAYDRADVVAERLHYRDGGAKACDLAVVRTCATRTGQDAAAAALNAAAGGRVQP